MKNLLFFTGRKTSPRPATDGSAARAFLEAFTDADQPLASANVTLAWIEQASVAIDTLITFRSALHRWHARGQVPDAEFVTEAERLRLARLAGWFDHLMAVGLTAEAMAVIRNEGR